MSTTCSCAGEQEFPVLSHKRSFSDPQARIGRQIVLFWSETASGRFQFAVDFVFVSSCFCPVRWLHTRDLSILHNLSKPNHPRDNNDAGKDLHLA